MKAILTTTRFSGRSLEIAYDFSGDECSYTAAATQVCMAPVVSTCGPDATVQAGYCHASFPAPDTQPPPGQPSLMVQPQASQIAGFCRCAHDRDTDLGRVLRLPRSECVSFVLQRTWGRSPAVSQPHHHRAGSRDRRGRRFRLPCAGAERVRRQLSSMPRRLRRRRRLRRWLGVLP